MSTIHRQRPRRPRFVAPLLIATLALRAPPVAAQAETEAAARALFEEGRRLIKGGDYAAACPKLEAAAKIHAGPGVLLNLGDCYERTNRTASAWAEFAEAEAMAARAGRTEQEAEASRRKALLDPLLCRLIVRVAGDVPGLAIARDGTPVDRAVWGAPLPVDPGEHVVEAAGPGRVSWSISVTIAKPAEVIVVDVPSLQPAPEPAPPAVAAADQKPRGPLWTAPRIAGAASVGAGGVALAIAGALGLAAKGKWNEAKYTETGTAQINDAQAATREGDLATGVAIGGSVVAVAGIVLWIAAPQLRSRVTTSGSGFRLEGTF